MVYLNSLILTFLLILILTFLQQKKKNIKNFFFFLLEINLIIYFKFIFIIIFISHIILFEIALLVYYISNFINIITDIFQNIISSNTAYCAGVPKLVESADPPHSYSYRRNYDYFDSEILDYQKTDFVKNLYKYNFPLLQRKDVFFDRNTQREMFNISYELNSICDQNIKIYNILIDKKATIAFNDNRGIQEINQNITKLINENFFKLKTLELCNNQLGIPLFNKLYETLYITNNVLPKFFKLDNILLNNICSFLFDYNYEDFQKQIAGTVLIVNNENSLKILEQTKGDFNIIHNYNYYSKSLLKTSSLLVNTNKELEELKMILKFNLSSNNEIVKDNFNFKINSIPSFYDTFSKLENLMIIKSTKLVNQEGFINNIDFEFRFNYLEEVFIKQLKEDPRMLHDIHYGQSNMEVNYNLLINKINNDISIKNYLNQKIIDRVLKASVGDFELKGVKRPRF